MARVDSGRVTELGYSPDGSRLAVAEQAGRITLLDANALTPVGQSVEVGEPVAWAAARPDDRTAVVLTGGPGESAFWVSRPRAGRSLTWSRARCCVGAGCRWRPPGGSTSLRTAASQLSAAATTST